jgi:hypothetical protein
MTICIQADGPLNNDEKKEEKERKGSPQFDPMMCSSCPPFASI